jgi:two-component system cell cycle response regulator DivK
VRATVLYIEDNPDNMMLARRAVEAIGCKMEGARNGLEGLKMAEELRPGIILLDINLPDIDGYEVARRMRASGNNYLMYVPIIAITANAMRGDAEKALEAGCDVYMSKPINIRELWARLEAFLTMQESPETGEGL